MHTGCPTASAPWRLADWLTHTSTVGGSAVMEVTEVAVRPSGPLPPLAVTTETPEARRRIAPLNAARNSSDSAGGVTASVGLRTVSATKKLNGIAVELVRPLHLHPVTHLVEGNHPH